MDGFKLVMDDGNFKQVRKQVFFIVGKKFDIRHQFRDFMMCRWNKNGIFDRRTSYPILTSAKFSGILMLAPHTLKQNLMGLPDKA